MTRLGSTCEPGHHEVARFEVLGPDREALGLVIVHEVKPGDLETWPHLQPGGYVVVTIGGDVLDGGRTSAEALALALTLAGFDVPHVCRADRPEHRCPGCGDDLVPMTDGRARWLQHWESDTCPRTGKVDARSSHAPTPPEETPAP